MTASEFTPAQLRQIERENERRYAASLDDKEPQPITSMWEDEDFLYEMAKEEK